MERPHRFGAVACPRSTGRGLVEFRLRHEDVANLPGNRHIRLRQVKYDQEYAVSCHLDDDEAVPVALTLLDCALTKFRNGA